MSHTIAQFTVFPVTEQVADPENQGWKSLLKRVITRLASYATRDECQARRNRGQNSFVDEHLLDPRLGPEISRTLHR